jgi:hypothetical protein
MHAENNYDYKEKVYLTQSYNIPCGKTNLVTIFIIGTLINLICIQKMADYGGSFSYEEYKNIANQQNSTLCTYVYVLYT